MTENDKTGAPGSSELSDDELEHAVGGLMARPGGVAPKPPTLSEDPCMGGE